jgi:hypothetical protein
MSRPDETPIADALNRIANYLSSLGTGNALTSGMGAIEMLALEVKNGTTSIADALYSVSTSLDQIASAHEEMARAQQAIASAIAGRRDEEA